MSHIYIQKRNSILTQEHMFSYNIHTMLEFKKGIDVLCVFQEGTPPIPRKFKIRYTNGEIKLITIDQVRFVEELYKNGISNHHFIYHCTSEIEDVLLNYSLKYYVTDMRWELLIQNP